MHRVLAGVYAELVDRHKFDDDLTEFFRKLAPQMEGAVTEDSIWLTKVDDDVFSHGALAPRNRRQDLKTLRDTIVTWATTDPSGSTHPSSPPNGTALGSSRQSGWDVAPPVPVFHSIAFEGGEPHGEGTQHPTRPEGPDSGQYPVLGPLGGNQGSEVTVVKGEPFPPTPKPSLGYGTPDKTKHKGS